VNLLATLNPKGDVALHSCVVITGTWLHCGFYERMASLLRQCRVQTTLTWPEASSRFRRWDSQREPDSTRRIGEGAGKCGFMVRSVAHC